MRRIVFTSLAIMATAALAQSARVSVTLEPATYANTFDAGTIPNASDFAPGKGRYIDMGNLCGYRVSVCAEPDSNITKTALLTAGTLIPWVYYADAGSMMTNADLNLTVGAPGAACRMFSDQVVASRVGGKLLYATSGMTGTAWDGGSLNVDGGGYSVRVDGWTCP